MPRTLDSKTIEEYLQVLDQSEDDMDSSGGEEADEEIYYENNRQLLADLVNEVDAEDVDFSVEGTSDNPPLIIDNADESSLENESEEPQNHQTVASRQRYGRVTWRRTNLTTIQNIQNFPQSIQYPNKILELSTPYQFFSYFFTQELRDKIQTESNLYATQKNLSNPFVISRNDLNKFLGILIYSSIVKNPNFRLYWSDQYGYEPIKSTMTQKHFEKICSVLHFNDNTTHLPQDHPNHDRLHKIRPVIDELNTRYATVPLEQRLSLDEQMCATKMGHYMKQYLPNKPHKWGFKLFLICSIYGFVHKFEVYSGSEKHLHINGEPDLGPTGNTVVRLARIVPRRANHIIYFDNFYTSIPLVTYLAKEGIYCLGTIQSNRIPNNKLPDKKTLMKKTVPRGHYEEQVANVDGVDISAVVWKDNRPVTLLSAYTGSLPITTISRYDKVTKQRVQINCPQVIKDYNSHMEGVDLLDSFIGRYHITRKSRKWTNRLFFHLLDMTIINSWLLYKRTLKQVNSTTKPMNLCNYRLELANALCNLGPQANGNKRGRPSSSSLEADFTAEKKAWACTKYAF
ncbi:unnamed protein product [Parnassius mnemosyne]|uniref:PiggyBac transposable element-derived protein domain-containing protein n=1 Tax=Parnassius mnemosyne TaxID=213953 RepID=A0AAV1LAI0_9NEOP